ncbi:MAG: hypothetical protein KBH07_11230 [Flavobacteriales bacterium]|nr:hypothetical protein [Flavobacteriales bacterium]MBP9081206.1 hypothetical protein [Flavobacteriales bacterium]
MNPFPPVPAPADDRWARRWGWAVIAAAVLLVYWPLSTFSYGLTYGDTLDCWLPWRWFIAQAFQDGHFPLWNPYAQSGYPVHADLQGPAWYPPAMALAGTVGHSLYTLQVLFLAYVIIGGIGLMRLVQRLHIDASIALVVGLAYALSGFFTAHQMHFYAVISGAWLPWLLAAQLRLIERPWWRPAVEAALFQALLLTGGNHTFTLIGTWLLMALIGVRAVQHWKHGDRPSIHRLLGHQAFFALLTVAMACGTFQAWWEVSPFLARAEGMAHADAAINPFTVRAMGSYFFPYALGNDAVWLGTDPTMANGFFGVVILVLAVLALARPRSATENTFAAFGLVCFLASFGAALPVHRWLWAAVPGLDLFRFPSYYQWFSALAALVLAAGTLHHWAALLHRRPRVVQGVMAAAVVAVLASLLWAWAMHGQEPPYGPGASRYERLSGLWRWHRVLLVAPATLLALAVLWWWSASPHRRWWALLAVVGLEMGWATTWAQWNTAVGDYAPAALQGRLAPMPQGPVWPELHPMAANANNSATLKYLWRNTQEFEGKPSHDGFNSFWLKEANRLAVHNAGLFAAMKRQPLVYLSDSVVAMEHYDPSTVDPLRHSALVVVPDAEVPKGPLLHVSTDTLVVAGFHHDGITLRTRTSHATIAVLQQAWYPGWTATVDGRPTPVIKANIACFGTVLPAGEHLLAFRYEKPFVPWLLGLSLLTFLGACWLLAFSGPATAFGLRSAVLLLTLAIGWSLLAHRPKAERLPREVEALLRQMDALPGARLPVVLNTDRFPALQAQFGDRPVRPLRADDPAWFDQVERTTAPLRKESFWWMDAGVPLPAAARAGLLQHHHVDTLLVNGGTVAVLLVPGTGLDRDTLLYRSAGPALLRDDAPWTTAYRVPAASLGAGGASTLVVQVAFRSCGGARPQVVVECRRGDAVIDYESYPLPHACGDEVQAVAVKHLRELRQAGGQVGVYVWNDGPDSVLVRDWSVALGSAGMETW